MRPLKAAFFIAILMFPGPVLPQQDGAGKERLEEVEGELKKSRNEREQLAAQTEATEAEIKALTERLIVSARRLQGNEQNVDASEAEIARLDQELEGKRSSLLGKRRMIRRMPVACGENQPSLPAEMFDVGVDDGN